LISFASTLPEMLFTLFVLYGLSGYAVWIYERIRRKPAEPLEAPPD
jgi:hypothetical protein